MKIGWKVINGYGPYAYLQKSVKTKSGGVKNEHVAYLGAIGKDATGLSEAGLHSAIVPGMYVVLPAIKDKGFKGGNLPVPEVGADIKAKLKSDKVKHGLKALESIVNTGGKKTEALKLWAENVSKKKQDKASAPELTSYGEIEKALGKSKTFREIVDVVKSFKNISDADYDVISLDAENKLAGKAGVRAGVIPLFAYPWIADASSQEDIDKVKAQFVHPHKDLFDSIDKAYAVVAKEKGIAKPVDENEDALVGALPVSNPWDVVEWAKDYGIDFKAMVKESGLKQSLAASLVADAYKGNLDQAVDDLLASATSNKERVAIQDAETYIIQKIGGPADKVAPNTGLPADDDYLEEAKEAIDLAANSGSPSQVNAAADKYLTAGILSPGVHKAITSHYLRHINDMASMKQEEIDAAAAKRAAPSTDSDEYKATQAYLAEAKQAIAEAAKTGMPSQVDYAATKYLKEGIDDEYGDGTWQTIAEDYAFYLNSVQSKFERLIAAYAGHKEGNSDSGLPDTIAAVDKGDIKLPNQEVPSTNVQAKQEVLLQADRKDYDKDLKQISGKKGSNEGGLYKDEKLETLHYIKWPKSELRAKIEALAASLYAYADVPVPQVRTVDFGGKTAVMSDWIDNTKPMTPTEMSKHKDVKDGFAVDAWLANWDTVGLSGDNVVLGEGNRAYRIDMGGSIIFRAQGAPKGFGFSVEELETLRDAKTNPSAAEAFSGLTAWDRRRSAKKLEAVTDAQIDMAVDAEDLPKTAPEYNQNEYGELADNLPEMLKTRLKQRRDYIVKNVLNAKKAKPKTLEQLQKEFGLSEDTIKRTHNVAKALKPKSPDSYQKWDIVEKAMKAEVGDDYIDYKNEVLKHYQAWKGSTGGTRGQALRWALGALYGKASGDRELERIKRFLTFINDSMGVYDHAKGYSKTMAGKRLVSALKVMRGYNGVILDAQNPGKDTIPVYRAWKPDQVKFYGWDKAKVGSAISIDDPPGYSWSFYPSVAKSFSGGHNSIITRAEVPIDKIVLTDLANSTGNYGQENEVIFKGVKNLEMEVKSRM